MSIKAAPKKSNSKDVAVEQDLAPKGTTPDLEVQAHGNQAAQADVAESPTETGSDLMSNLESLFGGGGGGPGFGGDDDEPSDTGFDGDVFGSGGFASAAPGGGDGGAPSGGGGDPIDPSNVPELAASSMGSGLAGETAAAMEGALGADLSNVQIHTDGPANQIAETMQAKAVTMGSDVFMGKDAEAPGTPAGDELLAHELAHTVQGAGGSGSSGGAGIGVSDPSSAAETSAKSAGAQAAKALHSGGPGADLGGKAAPSAPSKATTAMREELPGASSETTPSAPSSVEFSLAGVPISASLPAGATPGEVRVTLASPLPNVTLEPATVTFDSEWNVVGGSVRATASLGSVVNNATGTLSIAAGGAISGSIGADLVVGSVITGTVQVSFTAEGAVASGTVGAEGISLPSGLAVNEGSVSVNVGPDGVVSASGSVRGELPVGAFTLALTVDGETISGTMTVPLNSQNITDQVSITSGTLTGAYSDDGGTLTGSIAVGVGGFATGTLTGSYNVAANTFSGTASASLDSAITTNGVTFDSGSVTVSIADNTVESATCALTWSTESFSGDVNGSIDLATQVVSGSGSATLTSERDLGGGTTLTSATGTATLEEGALVFIEGSATANIAYQGEPTFQATISGMALNAQDLVLAGSASVVTMRALTFGTSNATVTVAEGASCSGTVSDNALTDLSGGLAFTIADAGGDFGSGTLEGSFADGALNATLTMTLDVDYGIPERGNTDNVILTGASATFSMEGGSLTEATVGGNFRVTNPSGSGGTVEGTVSGTWNLDSGAVEGSVSGSVVEPWPLESTVGTLTLTSGGTVSASIAGGELTEITGDIPYTAVIEGTETIELAGSISGTLDVQAGTVSGEATGTLTREIVFNGEVSGEGMESWSPVILAGSSITVTVEANDLVTATVAVDGVVRSPEGDVATASINGTMDLRDPVNGFSGTAEVTTTAELPWYEGTRFDSVMVEGSTASLTVTEGAPTEASGMFGFRLDEGGEAAANTIADGTWTPGSGISGEAIGDTLKDIEVWAEGTDALVLTMGSSFDLTLTSDNPESINGDLGLRLDDNEGPMAEGYIGAEWATEGDGVLSGSGDLTAARDLPVGDGAARFQPVVKEGSTAGAEVKDSQLDKMTGTLDTRLDEGDRPVADGSLSGEYRHAEDVFEGTGTGNVIDEIDAEVDAGEYAFFLEPGTSSNVVVEESELKQVDGSVQVRVDDNEGELLDLALSGSYNAVDSVVDGEASADFARRVELGGAGEYTIFGEQDTEASATVTNNSLSDLDGTLSVSVEDDEGLLLEAIGVGHAELGDAPTVDVLAEATVVREKDMGGLGGRYTFALLPGAGAEVLVEQNEVKQYGGTLQVRVDDGGDELALISLNGTYAEGEGFSGTGEATLLVDEYEAATMGDFTLVLMQGSGASITVESDNLTEMSADIPVGIQKSGSAFMTGQLNGTYQFQEEMFSGGGSLEVVQDEMLLPFGDSEFWLDSGSSGDVDVTENELTRIGGGVNLSLREGGDPYLEVGFQGQYDMAGGTGFTGGGGATVLREKRLFEGDGGYAFAIIAGTGVNATIDQNELTTLDGNVPFRVYDNEGPLVDGQVTGDWSKETGHITGSGSVFLARDVDFGPVKVLTGSGGEGTVDQSVLQEFTGQLTAVLSDDVGPLATLSAEGTFDAQENEIVELEGRVDLNRELEPLSGVKITSLSGEGRVENNEIKRVEGSGGILVEAVGVQGDFEAGWRKEGEEDVYWGTATVGQVEMDHEMGNSDRGISNAQISATLHEDETFDLEGGLDYNITENIGGSLNVQMDEELDPVLGGTLESSGTLLDENELFEKEFNLIPSVTVWLGPIPVTFGVAGGASAGLQALTYDFMVGVADFHILDMNVPELTGAEFGLDWGAQFDAYIAPFVGIGFDYSILTLMGGMEGQVIASLPIDIGMDASLYGGGDEFYGELAVGASISPAVTLQLNAFAEAELLGMGDRWEFEVGSHTFDDLFSMEWGTTYKFGDQTGKTDAAGPVTPSESESGTRELSVPPGAVAEGSSPSLGLSNQSSTAEGEAGLAVGGDDMELPTGGGDFPNPLAEYEPEFEAMGKAVDGVATIVGLVGENPLTAPVAVYDNWDAICDATDDIVDGLAAAGRLLRDLLPDWVTTVIDWVSEGLSAVADFFGDAWNAVTDFASDAWEGATDMASDAWDTVTGWF